MSGSVSLRLDSEGLAKAMKSKPDKMFRGGRKALEKSRMRFDRELQTKRLRGRPGLRRRSGRLAGSFSGETSGKTLGTLRMRHGTNLPYARIHEFGGVIRPRKGKFLTIPTTLNRTRAGVTRRSLREFAHVVFIRSKKGTLIAMAGDDKDNLRPMFFLVRQVRIKPRLGFRRTWVTEKRRLLADVNREIREALRA